MMADEEARKELNDTREKAERNGWRVDYDHERRRPRQSHKEGRAGTVRTPSWEFACVECRASKRYASEYWQHWDYCNDCDEWRNFHPLGVLMYP